MIDSDTNAETISRILYEDLIGKINDVGILSYRYIASIGLSILLSSLDIEDEKNKIKFIKDIEPILDKWNERREETTNE